MANKERPLYSILPRVCMAEIILVSMKSEPGSFKRLTACHTDYLES